jgi:hypothetical protein
MRLPMVPPAPKREILAMRRVLPKGFWGFRGFPVMVIVRERRT